MDDNKNNIVQFPKKETIEDQRSPFDEILDEGKYLQKKMDEISTQKPILEAKWREAKLQNKSGAVGIEFQIEDQEKLFDDTEKKLTMLGMEVSAIMRDKEIPLESVTKKRNDFFRNEITGLLHILKNDKDGVFWNKEEIGSIKDKIKDRIKFLESQGEAIQLSQEEKDLLGIKPEEKKFDEVEKKEDPVAQQLEILDDEDKLVKAKQRVGKLMEEGRQKMERIQSGELSAEEKQSLGEELALINIEIKALEEFIKKSGGDIGPDQ